MRRIRQRHDLRGLKGLCAVNGPAGRPSSNPAGSDMVIWTLTLTTRVFDTQGLQFAASAENLMDTEPKGGERPANLSPCHGQKVEFPRQW